MPTPGCLIAVDPALEPLFRRIGWRLIPFLFVCYLCAYLDRVNVGFAKLQMSVDLGFSETIYGFGAGIFFIGYFLFEVPSNLLLHRMGARRCLSRIMVTWGLISAGMAWVESPTAFYLLRFLLGVAEAGFFPGVILYLTYWYPAARRGAVISLFVTAVAVSSVVGAPLSGYIMQTFNDYHGMAGWQWLFVLEGLPSVACGIAAFFYLDDKVADARWLSESDRVRLADLLAAEAATLPMHHALAALKHPRVWLLASIYFSLVLGLYGLNFWMPTIIKELGFSDLGDIGLLSALPFGAAAIVMVLIGRHADRTGERRWHIVVPALLGALGLGASTLTSNPLFTLATLTLGTCGVLSAIPQTWPLATAFLGGGAAAAGIALINSFGNLSGFVGPYAIGWLKDATGSTASGVALLAVFLIFGALLVLRMPASAERN